MSGSDVTARTAARLRGDNGGGLVEYALLISLIFLVAIAAVQLFASNATSKFSNAATQICQADGSTC